MPELSEVLKQLDVAIREHVEAAVEDVVPVDLDAKLEDFERRMTDLEMPDA